MFTVIFCNLYHGFIFFDRNEMVIECGLSFSDLDDYCVLMKFDTRNGTGAC